jgi:hypothetical protein
MTDQLEPSDDGRTDQGVPVGGADVEADVERASDERADEPDRDEFLQIGAVEGSADQGVPVGAADAEEDRRRATQGD